MACRYLPAVHVLCWLRECAGNECVQYFMYMYTACPVTKELEWLLQCECDPLQVIDEVKPVMKQPRSPLVQVQCVCV